MTLIEIIVVIAILTLMTAAVAMQVIPWLDKSKQKRAVMDVASVKQMLDTYYVQKGHYPDPGVGLQALIDAQITDHPPIDPWEHELAYSLENGKPVVVSYGKDGLPGGEGFDADVSSKDVPVAKK